MTYTDDSLMPFGKYKGQKLANVPDSYLIWLHNNTDFKRLDSGLMMYIQDNFPQCKKGSR